tara:strand:- start:862 stop:1119 length:258 start_codon:yes stop_codon:yes gene_type:complete
MSSLKSFKAALEEEYSFPTEYVFKFIIKSSSKQDVIDLLPDAMIKEKKSTKGKYVSITLTQFVKNSSEIVYIYEKASKIKGVISL